MQGLMMQGNYVLEIQFKKQSNGYNIMITCFYFILIKFNNVLQDNQITNLNMIILKRNYSQ